MTAELVIYMLEVTELELKIMIAVHFYSQQSVFLYLYIGDYNNANLLKFTQNMISGLISAQIDNNFLLLFHTCVSIL